MASQSQLQDPTRTTPGPEARDLFPEPHLKKTSRYYWGEDFDESQKHKRPVYPGYVEDGEIVGDGSVATLEGILDAGLKVLNTVFNDVGQSSSQTGSVVSLSLSDDLLRWRDQQWEKGRILPTKGNGLKRTSEEVIRLLGAEAWPEPLLTNGALFGSGFANLLNGAHVSTSDLKQDAPTLIRRTGCRHALFKLLL